MATLAVAPGPRSGVLCFKVGIDRSTDHGGLVLTARQGVEGDWAVAARQAAGRETGV